MIKRERKRRYLWPVLLILLVLGVGSLVGYYLTREDRGKDWEKISGPENLDRDREPILQIRMPAPIQEEEKAAEAFSEETPLSEEDHCKRVENGILDFFQYLDNKDYIKRFKGGKGTYDHFKSMIRKLSSRAPIPAGEGIDSRMMAKNIFYLFRVLDKNDLRLIKAILGNEADTLDINMDMFYNWLMMGDRCPNLDGLRPSPDVLYQYAGFFMNTIGGRAYLFRRQLEVRLLVTYYSLLIVHEADKRGKNIYGIDVFPEIARLTKELSYYPDFHFQADYIDQMTRLQDYYLKRR